MGHLLLSLGIELYGTLDYCDKVPEDINQLIVNAILNEHSCLLMAFASAHIFTHFLGFKF